MNFVSDQGFDISKGAAAQFQAWLADNEEKLKAACPAGVEYVGTFANVFTSEKSAGAFRTLWAFENYAAMDNFADAMKADDDFAALMNGLAEFILDPRDGGDWTNILSRRVTTAAIWGDEG